MPVPNRVPLLLSLRTLPVTATQTGSDGFGQIRVRLQSTTAVAVQATDDFYLQWEKNANGTWTNVGTGAVVGYDSPTLTESGRRPIG